MNFFNVIIIFNITEMENSQKMYKNFAQICQNDQFGRGCFKKTDMVILFYMFIHSARLYTTQAQCPEISEEGIGCCGIGITEGCKPTCGS